MTDYDGGRVLRFGLSGSPSATSLVVDGLALPPDVVNVGNRQFAIDSAGGDSAIMELVDGNLMPFADNRGG